MQPCGTPSGYCLVLWIAVGMLLVDAYPGGAPASTCSSMLPSHRGASAQTSTSSYTLTASSTSVQSGSTIAVTLSGGSFAGFLLEARSVSSDAYVGTFSNLPSGTKLLCSNAGVTHTSDSSKSSITVTYTPPSGVDAIYFIATVAQSYGTFWTNIRSLTVSIQSSADSATSSTTSPSLVEGVNTFSQPTQSSTPGGDDDQGWSTLKSILLSSVSAGEQPGVSEGQEGSEGGDDSGSHDRDERRGGFGGFWGRGGREKGHGGHGRGG